MVAAAVIAAGCGAQSSPVAVEHEQPAKVGFYGNWYVPPDQGPWFRVDRPAILLLGGSNGGLPGDLGAVLARHGFPTLALAYFREPGLPQRLESIPLEYFRNALRWTAARPEVDPRRIAAFGISRGGELALLLASRYPGLIHGAIGYVPSANAFPAPGGNTAAWTHAGIPVLGPIAVERIRGPVFVVGAGRDALWPSAAYVETIASRMHSHGRRDVTALAYGRAGHLVGKVVPGPESSTRVKSIYGELELGGSPAADEAAREDSWPKLLRFLGHL